jgi:hypothetical protein
VCMVVSVCMGVCVVCVEGVYACVRVCVCVCVCLIVAQCVCQRERECV